MKISATTLLFTILVAILFQVSQTAPARGGQGNGGRGGGGHGGPSNGEPNGPGPGRKCRYDFDREEWICRDGGRDDWCVPGRGRDC